MRVCGGRGRGSEGGCVGRALLLKRHLCAVDVSAQGQQLRGQLVVPYSGRVDERRPATGRGNVDEGTSLDGLEDELLVLVVDPGGGGACVCEGGGGACEKAATRGAAWVRGAVEGKKMRLPPEHASLSDEQGHNLASALRGHAGD